MTTRWPSSGFGAVSSVQRYHQSTIIHTTHLTLRWHIVASCRRYASQGPADTKAVKDVEQPEKAALLTVQGKLRSHPLNAPRSTLPPLLTLPNRGPENVFLYYYRIGKAYGSFYFRGVKAVWFNYKAAGLIKARVKKAQEDAAAALKDNETTSTTPPNLLELVTRAEYQILARNSHDIGKLPLFSVLVALLGEWLPVFVPFMPGVVPGTCRIPKQVTGMREKAEQRRRTSFRNAIPEPTVEQVDQTTPWPDSAYAAPPSSSSVHLPRWPLCSRRNAVALLGRLRPDQLQHLSATLNVHNRAWDWFNIPPPSGLLRRALARRFEYIAGDDVLFLLHGGPSGARGVPSQLSTEELRLACEERGIDVNGRKEELLQKDLTAWLQRQRGDSGAGRVMLLMLFRR